MKRLSFLFAAKLFALTLLLTAVFPVVASAAQLENRKLTLSTSQVNTAATWTFTFNAAGTTALNGISFRICDAPSGTCNTPGSWSNSGAAFSTLTYNGSGQAGWTLDNAGAGGAQYLGIKNNTSSTATANPIVATFTTVTNPNHSPVNKTFYVRVATFTGDDFTSQLDTGVVAAATAQQISITGTMDESLVFCAGTSITGQDCSTISGSAVTLDNATFSTTATRSGTSVMAASTNGAYGYAITVNGNTLTCTTCNGTKTITAMSGAANTSTTGTEEFGMNLKDNATPNVGAEVSGSGSAASADPYDDVDEYFFQSGDTVANVAGATDANTFTAAYIINVAGSTEAGTYTTTLTYIATATF